MTNNQQHSRQKDDRDPDRKKKEGAKCGKKIQNGECGLVKPGTDQWR